MKKMRRLIPAIAMLLVSAVMLSTASFAWFTMGTYAEATGMTVQADSASTLLLVNKYDTTTELQKFQDAKNTIDLTAYNAAAALIPATYKEDSDSTLARPDDPTKVVHATGALGTATLVDVAVSGTNGNEYYIDYTLYLFAAGTAVTGKNLQVTVTPDAFSDDIHNAVSINFLVGEDKDADPTYVDKINFETAKKGGEDAQVDLGQIDIPVGMNEDLSEVVDYVIVTMRVYYDGALPDAADNTKMYVRNDRVSTAGVGFKVRFDLVTGN